MLSFSLYILWRGDLETSQSGNVGEGSEGGTIKRTVTVEDTGRMEEGDSSQNEVSIVCSLLSCLQ